MTFAAFVFDTLIAGAGLSIDTPRDYPLQAVHAEFVAACGDLINLDAAHLTLLESGWVRSLPVGSSPIGRLVAFQERQGRQIIRAEGAEPSKPFIYRKAVHGRTLDLMLQSADLDGGYVNGCRLWDFDVREPPALNALRSLAEGKPAVVKADNLLRLDWPSTEEVGMQGLQIVYIAREHHISKLVGANGLNFKIAYIGIEQE